MSHIYKAYNDEEKQNLFSQFLISSWSYSKVSGFARNQKAFEMQYIFGIYSRKSAGTIAGNSYHHALQYYFTKKKEGETLDIVELEASAFAYLNEQPSNIWKLQKTTPTVEKCIEVATKTVAALLRFFVKEKSAYEDDIAEILEVEVYCDEWLTVSGVDIPMPCHGMIDLVVKTKTGKIAIIDHKSKKAFTDDEEVALSIGIQAITYIKLYEEKTGIDVSEVWFAENKYSENKNGASQINVCKIVLDDNTRKLYEALLYEPLKCMIEAVNNPDHIYLINESDNFVDRAELYDFWARTMICEVEDFNVEESKKDLIAKRLKKVRDSSIEIISPAVIKQFKENASQFIQYDLSNKNMTHAEKIQHVLRSFGIIVEVSHMFDGYSSNTYLLSVSAGVKVGSIHSRRLDIANALDVSNVRVSNEMVVYEGKSYLAVEFAKKRERDLIFDPSALVGYKIPLGKDNYGNVVYWDLSNPSTPHALVCGQTGSGKSVNLQVVLEYAKQAGIQDIYIMDPKREFTRYHDHNQVFVYTEIEDIEEQMANLVKEMESRVASKKSSKVLIIFDEFADAVANSRKGTELDVKEMVQVGTYAPKKGLFGMLEPGGPKMQLKTTGTLKSLEENLRIILQKGRSLGFNVLAATQRASVKVITGDAKVNFPVQICFKVPKEVDSKVVIDEGGAESLAGKGDGLIKSPEYNDTVRFQSYFYDKVGGAGTVIARKDDELEVIMIEEA